MHFIWSSGFRNCRSDDVELAANTPLSCGERQFHPQKNRPHFTICNIGRSALYQWPILGPLWPTGRYGRCIVKRYRPSLVCRKSAYNGLTFQATPHSLFQLSTIRLRFNVLSIDFVRVTNCFMIYV